jgi:hypothetical protein
MPKQDDNKRTPPPHDDSWLKEFDDDILREVWMDMAKEKEAEKAKEKKPTTPFVPRQNKR